MKAIRILLFIAFGLAALLIALGLFARKQYHIERSVTIEAPYALVYEQLRYFKHFEKWSPWNSLDPNMKSGISGTDGEKGAVYAWDGNGDVGKGTLTITGVQPNRIDLQERVEDPWESTSPAFFTIEALNDTVVKVSWGFDMIIGFPWNGLAMFTDVDAGVGKDFDRGLNNLKKLCEKKVKRIYRGLIVVDSSAVAQLYIGIRDTLPQSEVADFYREHFPKLLEMAKKDKLADYGAPCCLIYMWDDSTKTADVAAVLPVPKPLSWPEYANFELEAGKSLFVVYRGVYDSIGLAHHALEEYMADKNLEHVLPAVETYLSDPALEPDSTKWLTRVSYRVLPKR